MIRITLNAEDAARYDVPEVVEYEKPRLKEVRELKRQCGVSLAELDEGIRSGDDETYGMLAWLAVRRAGASVAWEDFDLDLADLSTEKVDVDPKEVKTK